MVDLAPEGEVEKYSAVTFAIAKLSLQEGDVLVIQSDTQPHDQWWEYLRTKVLPHGVRGLWIPNNVQLRVLTARELENRYGASNPFRTGAPPTP